LCLCLTMHHLMKTFGVSRSTIPRILSLGNRQKLTGCWDSRSGRYTSLNRAPDTYWIGGWGLPRLGLNAAGKRKIPFPAPAGNRILIVQPVATLTILTKLLWLLSSVKEPLKTPKIVIVCWTIRVLGLDFWRGLGIFLFATASRTALGLTQSPILWVPGAPSLGIKRPGREANNSPPSSGEVKEWVELYLRYPNTGVVLS
jgi:hypothetical protein